MFDVTRIFSKKQKSGSCAKDRLQLVLIHDRINCSSDVVEALRKDIIAVISKYMDIENEGIDIEIDHVKITQNEQLAPILSANIPIKNLKKPQ